MTLNYYISHPIKVFLCIWKVLDFPLICHTPSKFLSHPARSRHLRHLKLLKDSKFAALQCPFYKIGASARPMVAFSSFYESHKPPSLGDACSIVQSQWPLKRPAKLVHVPLSFCWLSPWWPPGQYGASSRPMVALGGFRWSPGHAASGDALGIASAYCHGHWNCPRWRCIRSPPLHILTAVIVAKDHVMVH